MASQHAREVFTLYRRLLRLHQRLPPDFAYLGSKFVKEEFKRHKKAEPEYAAKFMVEWKVSPCIFRDSGSTCIP